ncbi:class I SAM-dependent methyltransferase [Streptomyces fuscichromogenes]|uniref:Methyltransferase MycE N-terminal domain-containing protein n=1 Tax=Streptomyces fuscichromogenes TaxID=1324013 RepID=A0A918CV70_9ACTN|nr:class I SAM-dependent methyltransferase [Streptomyces fuscichromogenes]GGN33637.1 hypothetical protein GCM10011578_073610 [Streptomyces fuscichromogenes]
MSAEARALENTLIGLADRPDGEAAARLAEIGAARCAGVLLRELASRAALFPEPAGKTTVLVTLLLGGEPLRYGITLGGGVHEVTGAPETAVASLTQDLVELLRSLHGAPGRHTATLDLQVAEPDRPLFDPADPAHAQRASAVTALHQLAAVINRREHSLDELAVRFGSDKWGGHWYTPHYDRYFAPLRNRPVTVLEIGIGGYDAPDQGGASLRMWKHYFPRGTVYGLDIHEKHGIAEPRLVPLQGDQADARYLEELARDSGPFDIVIDDGSHLNHHVLTSFRTLLPHVRPGGLYVIEDVQTAYWPGWGGNDSDLDDPGTSMGLVKGLLDGLNHQERRPAADAAGPSYTDRNIAGVHVHHNLVVIEKAVNAEQGAPSWVPRDTDPESWYTDAAKNN